MYNGVVNVNNLDASEILELLETCDEYELNFNELVEDLQDHLLIQHKEWIQQNLIYFYKISSKHQTFNLLQGYYNELIDNNPELYKEVLRYYLDDKWQPRLLPQKGPRIAKGLLNYKMKMLISNWIDGRNGLGNLHSLPYNYELIFSGSQGLSRSIFEKKCSN